MMNLDIEIDLVAALTKDERLLFSGMGYWSGLRLPPRLELIEEAKKVYNILIEQRK